MASGSGGEDLISSNSFQQPPPKGLSLHLISCVTFKESHLGVGGWFWNPKGGKKKKNINKKARCL